MVRGEALGSILLSIMRNITYAESSIYMYEATASPPIAGSVSRQVVMKVGEDETPKPLRNRELIERAKSYLTSATAYIMPLVAITPNIYTGLMTIPLLGYLIMMVTNLSAYPEGPLYLLFGGSIPDLIILLLGLAFAVYSIVFLRRNRPVGLVTTGPYRIVRHPQYLGFILLTCALTGKSVWILEHTFGIGFLGVPETIAAWFVMMFAYVGLALFEERHLLNVYQEGWTHYRENVGFLVPLLAGQRRGLEVVAAVILFAGLMFILVLFDSSF